VTAPVSGTARIAAALYGDEWAEYVDSPRMTSLMPVVNALAAERAAAELERAAVKLDVEDWAKHWLRNRAAALRKEAGR
jgi:hypothetical protein